MSLQSAHVISDPLTDAVVDREGLSSRDDNPMIETYEHLVILGMYGGLFPTTTLALTGFVASKTTMMVFYVGVLLVLAIIPVIAFIGNTIARLHRARIERRPSTFVERRIARFAIAWLEHLSVNFAYVDGRPKRWYHFRNWGKYW